MSFQMDELIDSPFDVLKGDAVAALTQYDEASLAVQSALEPFGAAFLDCAYRLWLAYEADPAQLGRDVADAGIRLTGHQKSRFSTVVKILHIKAGLKSDLRRFASKHAKMLEVIDEELVPQTDDGKGQSVRVIPKAGDIAKAIKDCGGIGAIVAMSGSPKSPPTIDLDVMEAVDDWVHDGKTELPPNNGLYRAVINLKDGVVVGVRVVDSVEHDDEELRKAVRAWLLRRKRLKDFVSEQAQDVTHGDHSEEALRLMDEAILPDLPNRS